MSTTMTAKAAAKKEAAKAALVLAQEQHAAAEAAYRADRSVANGEALNAAFEAMRKAAMKAHF